MNGLPTSSVKDYAAGDTSIQNKRALENQISHIVLKEHSKDSSSNFETEELCSNPDEDVVVCRM